MHSGGWTDAEAAPCSGGKTILESGVILRGDLRRAGTGAAVVLALGKYCRLGANCIIRPPYKTYKG